MSSRKKHDKEFKKTQSTSSPGTLGEDANRNQQQASDPISRITKETNKEEGLNEQRSAGSAGPFEGVDNTGER